MPVTSAAKEYLKKMRVWGASIGILCLAAGTEAFGTTYGIGKICSARSPATCLRQSNNQPDTGRGSVRNPVKNPPAHPGTSWSRHRGGLRDDRLMVFGMLQDAAVADQWFKDQV